jgi:predicted  nucleic acid-binding Zn-ribbon protein
MADPFDTLLEVQEHDTALARLRHRLETLPERSALAELARRQRELEAAAGEVRAQVEDLEGRQQALEERIAAAAARRHELERRMRSAEGFAARDLEAIDHETQQLATRQAHYEEEEIALLEEEEPLDETLAGQEEMAARLRAEAEQLKTAVAEAEADIAVSLREEEAARAELAAQLPADLAERYERLRAKLGGVGAARLVGDRCDGCHLTLPSVDVDHIRHLPAGELALCTQCDRILVR